GNVIPLGWVQGDLTRINRRLLTISRSASTVPDVADCVLPQQFLTGFARQQAGAALSYHWHITGMEVRTESRDDARARCRASRVRRIRCALRVNVEGPVFLNDPTIVGDLCGLVSTIYHRYL